VACVQQRLYLRDDADACRDDLARYLRPAQAKGARLAVFPELAGMAVLSPMLQGRRAGLLRQAERARQPRASLWTRAKGRLAESTAGLLKVSFRQALTQLLAEEAARLWRAYRDLFSWAAREYGMTIVAGSGYLLDEMGAVANQAAVFGPDGALAGQQSKVAVSVDEQDLATPGPGWSVIESQVGRIGVLLGNDMLFPEAGRILAYQGAQILVGLCAVPGGAAFRRFRTGMAARAEENQLFGVLSFLVGSNPLASGARQDWAGQSAILAPSDLTPDRSGVLVQVGTANSEGVITAQCDFEALHDLWRKGGTSLRRKMPVAAFAELAGRYSHGQTLDDTWTSQPGEDAARRVQSQFQPVAELLAVSGGSVQSAGPGYARPDAGPPDGKTPGVSADVVAGAPFVPELLAAEPAEILDAREADDSSHAGADGPERSSEAADGDAEQP
jgi:predicted amidohydrolase